MHLVEDTVPHVYKMDMHNHFVRKFSIFDKNAILSRFLLEKMTCERIINLYKVDISEELTLTVLAVWPIVVFLCLWGFDTPCFFMLLLHCNKFSCEKCRAN